MKRALRVAVLTLAAILTFLLAGGLAACHNDPGTEETADPTGAATPGVTPGVTDAPTVPAAETEKETPPMTEPVTLPATEPVTEAPTETETEPETERVPDGTLPFVPSRPETIDKDWKAIWLSQFDLQSIYTSGGKQRPQADFRQKMVEVLDNVVSDGFNTIVVQLRPYADSMYPSEIYPPSRYTVGTYAADFTYDPFAIIMELAGERNLSVHAWINPMRGMTEAEIQQVDDRYVIKQWYNDQTKKGTLITFQSKNWYLNPAYPEVRRLICDGVAEILEKYHVDGVHMDDYFYPTTEASFDAKAYNAYKQEGGTADLLSWRRHNLDALVSELYATVKAHDLRALFGISPAGNINTVYNSHCADVYNWCKNPGYIDYICPQVYFGFEHASWDFVKTCHLWSDAIQTDYVSLIIGVSFGKAVSGVDNYAGAGKDEWSKHKDIMARSLEHSATLEKCVGMTVFCYQHLFEIGSGHYLPASKQEHEAFAERLHTITWHKNESETTD